MLYFAPWTRVSIVLDILGSDLVGFNYENPMDVLTDEHVPFFRETALYLRYVGFVMHFRSCFGMSLWPRPGLKLRKGSDGAVEDIGTQILLLLTMDIACGHVFEVANCVCTRVRGGKF